MATYNGEKYIKEQLSSILVQLSLSDEVIISDDSSTDDTIRIIESFNDSRIILLKNQTFHSHVYNFENALNHAKGSKIFLADQDDIWLPKKVEKMCHLLEKYDLVLSDAVVINNGQEILHGSFFTLNHSRQGFFKNLYKNSYLGCCMAFNRKLLELTFPFPKNINMHDWWIGLNAELYGTVFFSKEKLIKYRRHNQTLTPIDQKSTNPFLKKIGFRVAMMKGLILQRFSKGKVS